MSWLAVAPPRPSALLIGPSTPGVGAVMRQRCSLLNAPSLTTTSLLTMNSVCSSGCAVKYCHACTAARHGVVSRRRHS
jgi:hypothetical protein